ncbi:hypothetical protein VTN31DRAFT_6581 [Thermomyces dupontii]|uniref:uncharacterized protein n=1 Tax=Talaromyces thermophilus TaxID=28565 RepID=UPI0037435FDF
MTSTLEAKKCRRRRDYPFHLEYRTRWSDNDVYGHLNNSIYAFLIDSVINTYLIQHCGLDLESVAKGVPKEKEKDKPHGHGHGQIGLVVSSYCDYFASMSFPAVLDLGLRVVRLGSSSVTYEVGVFERGDDAVKAVGGFTHVFVDRDTRRPVRGGMHESIRNGLKKLVVSDDMSTAKL